MDRPSSRPTRLRAAPARRHRVQRAHHPALPRPASGLLHVLTQPRRSAGGVVELSPLVSLRPLRCGRRARRGLATVLGYYQAQQAQQALATASTAGNGQGVDGDPAERGRQHERCRHLRRRRYRRPRPSVTARRGRKQRSGLRQCSEHAQPLPVADHVAAITPPPAGVSGDLRSTARQPYRTCRLRPQSLRRARGSHPSLSCSSGDRAAAARAPRAPPAGRLGVRDQARVVPKPAGRARLLRPRRRTRPARGSALARLNHPNVCRYYSAGWRPTGRRF